MAAEFWRIAYARAPLTSNMTLGTIPMLSPNRWWITWMHRHAAQRDRPGRTGLAETSLRDAGIHPQRHPGWQPGRSFRDQKRAGGYLGAGLPGPFRQCPNGGCRLLFSRPARRAGRTPPAGAVLL